MKKLMPLIFVVLLWTLTVGPGFTENSSRLASEIVNSVSESAAIQTFNQKATIHFGKISDTV